MSKTECTIEWVYQRVDHYWRLLRFGYETGAGVFFEPDMSRPPIVEFSRRMTSTAGYAFSFLHTVKFSLYFMEHETMESFDPTIAHEVAHVFVDRWYGKDCGHRHLWKEAMIGLGLPPERCHQYKTAACRKKQERTRILCSCGKTVSIGPTQLKKLMRGAHYRCRYCNAQIDSNVVG